MISSSQRPLPDNTQHSQQANIHAPGGIRNHDLSRRAAADLRLRPRGYWDRQFVGILLIIFDEHWHNNTFSNVSISSWHNTMQIDMSSACQGSSDAIPSFAPNSFLDSILRHYHLQYHLQFYCISEILQVLFWWFITVDKMYKQTHSVYGIGLHNIHRACIHFKSITSGSTSLNETCDLRLKHSHTTSLANQNMYLVSSKQIILLWAWQHFHCTTLPTLAENNSISSTTLPLASLCSHL